LLGTVIRLAAAESVDISIGVAVERMNASQTKLDGLQDYSCTMLWQDGPGETSSARLMVRHEPFSINARSGTNPETQIIYVEGRNNGKLHASSSPNCFVRPIWLLPTGTIAMWGRQYPWNEIDIKHTAERYERLISGMQEQPGVEAKWVEGAKLNGRLCSVLQIRQALPESRYEVLRVFFDAELSVPVRFARWNAATRTPDPDDLVEAYTYLLVKFGRGLTDTAFDPERFYRYRLPAVTKQGREETKPPLPTSTPTRRVRECLLRRRAGR